MSAKLKQDYYFQTPSHGTGIAFACEKGHSVTLIVLPKIWKKQQHPQGKIDTGAMTWSKKQEVLVVYENQYVHVSLGEECAEELLQIRNQIMENLLSEVEKNISEDEQEEQEEQLKPLLSGIAEQEYLRKISSQKKDKNGYPIKDALLLDTDLKVAMSDILHLLSLIRYSGFQNPSGSLEEPCSDDMLRPYLHFLFVKEMEEQYHHIRRGYIPRTEYLGTIRGRIDPVSAARIEESGELQILCHYDEFAEGTLLMRVLVSALDIVAGGNWLTRYRENEEVVQEELNLGNTQNKAVQLRRFLHEIPSFPRKIAANNTLQIRTNRMTACFKKALEYAKLLLFDEQILLLEADELQNSSWCWNVDMSDIWERLLFNGLKQMQENRGEKDGEKTGVMYYDQGEGDLSVYPRNDIRGAFGEREDSNSKPDLLLKTDGGINWVLDAKYSYFSQLNKLPSGGYRDQMFRYLYLMSKEQEKAHAESKVLDWKNNRISEPWADQLALLYATDQSVENIEKINRQRRLLSQGIWADNWKKEHPHLHQFVLPFPAQNEVKNIQSWEKYQKRMTSALQKIFYPE